MEFDELRKMEEYNSECARELARNEIKAEIEKREKDKKNKKLLNKEIFIGILILVALYFLYRMFGSFLN